MATGLTLVCPVRGRLTRKSRSPDGLSPTEECFRVDMIRHLIAHGYDPDNIRAEVVIRRFGSGGRNSFRADVVVLDVPVADIPAGDIDAVLRHAVVLGEVKRDHADAEEAESFQVWPMLDFAVAKRPETDCVALYWDDVEQRVYWYDSDKEEHTGPLTALPPPGHKPGARPLTFTDLASDASLLAVFERIEDILHSASVGPSKRFPVMLQLLLAKLHDEHDHDSRPGEPMTIQDFDALDVHPVTAASTMNKLLKDALKSYKTFLPEPVEETFPIGGQVLLDVTRVLAPVKIVAMAQSVIQDFYMYFARHIYKWDLAQYFTPTSPSFHLR